MCVFRRTQHIWLGPSHSCSVYTGPEFGHHCTYGSFNTYLCYVISRTRAEYKVSCQVSMAINDLVQTLLITWLNKYGRRDLVKSRDSAMASEQVIRFSTLYIKSQYVPLSPSCCRTHCLHISSGWRHQMKAFSALLVLCEGNPPVAKASDEELWCFLWCALEHTVEQTLGMPLIWDALSPIVTSQ